MQSTTNAFLDGITTDLHPLNIPETALTSALNATVFTGNGNEGLLQNDMGNTLIKDSITGSIMALNDGFIPLGMKEHGGILYIASYNPETKEGELGSIPSPIIHYSLNGIVKDSTRPRQNTVAISDIGPESNGESNIVDTTDISVVDRLNTNTLYILSDYIFHCGDKFIVSLDLDLEKNDQNELLSQTRVDRIYPLITKFDVDLRTGDYSVVRGWVRIELYSILSTGKEVHLGGLDSVPQLYYQSNGASTYSTYWFLDNITDIDEIRTRTTDMFKTYPNIPAGRLAIKFIVEYPGELQCVYNSSYSANLPQVYNITKNNISKNYVIIPGFTYEADCPIRPDLIKVTCNNGTIPVKTFASDSKIFKTKNYRQEEDTVEKDVEPGTIIVAENYKNPSVRLTTDIPVLLESEENTLPYSSLRYINNPSNLAGNNLAISSRVGDTNTYIISKFSNGGQYPIFDDISTGIPVKNYSLNDHEGLFYIELDSFNTDLEFTLELYTLSLNSDPNGPFGYNNYVLYKTQTLPKFNPATIYLELTGGVSDLIYVPQYLDINKGDNAKYDIELFHNIGQNDQRCFLYDKFENIVEYDSETNEYVIKEYDGHPCTLLLFQNFKTYIYPQYTTITENWYAWIGSEQYKRPCYIWSAIPFGYKNFGNKQDYDNSARYNSKNVWLKTSKANDWEWFVVSPVMPQVKVELNGATYMKNFLMPITRSGDVSNTNWVDKVLDDAKRLRDYFKAQKEIGEFSAEDLHKYCLCNTNLNITRYKVDIPGYIGTILNGGNELNGDTQQWMDNFVKTGRELSLFSGLDGIEHITNDSTLLGLQYNALAYIKGDDGKNGFPDSKAVFGSYASKSSGGTGNTHDMRRYHGIHDFYFATTNESDAERLTSSYNSSDGTLDNIMDNRLTSRWIGQLDGSKGDSNITTRRYCTGFITEAMKHCPLHVLAGENKTVMNLNLFNYKYGLDYIYCHLNADGEEDNNTSIWFNNNQGSGLIYPHFPIVNIQDNRYVVDSGATTSGGGGGWDPKEKDSNASKIKITQSLISNGKIVETRTADYTERGRYYENKIIGVNVGSPGNLDGIKIPYNASKYTIKTNIAVNPNTTGLNATEKLVYADNNMVVNSPQLFINKDESGLSKNYKGEYTIAPIIPISNDGSGLLKQSSDGKYELSLSLSNIDPTTSFGTNLSDIFQQGSANVECINPTDKPSGKNSFTNNTRYIYIDSSKTLKVKLLKINELSLNKGLYVFCLSYNEAATCSIEVSFTVNGNIIKYTLCTPSSDHKHFVPFYYNDGELINNIELTFGSGTCWVGGCDIYRVDYGNDSLKLNQDIKNWLNENAVNLTPNTNIFIDDSNILNNLVFPGVACFEEYGIGSVTLSSANIYSGTSVTPRRNSSSTTRLSGSVNFNPLIELDASKSGVTGFIKLGCLDTEFAGFLELPEFPYLECVCTYGLDETKRLAKIKMIASRYKDVDIEMEFGELGKIRQIENMTVRQINQQ